MIDWYLHGESSRISPEAPVPVVNFKESKFQLGGAANVANNLKHLEIEPFLIGAIGNDHFGSLLKEHLKAEKIKFNLLTEKSFQTICKQRLMSSNQQLARIDYEKYFHGSKLTNLFNTFIKNIAKTEIRFRDVYPTSLGALNYNVAASDIDYINVAASFNYSLYEIHQISTI